MPTTLSEPAADQTDKRLTGIYIARGEDTLGPYDLLEAAALVQSGYLRLDDLAAHNDDPAWVALATMLPAETVAAKAVAAETAGGTHSQRDIDLGGVHDPQPVEIGESVDATPAPLLAPAFRMDKTGGTKTFGRATQPRHWQRLVAVSAGLFGLALGTIGVVRAYESRHIAFPKKATVAQGTTPVATVAVVRPAPLPMREEVAAVTGPMTASLAPGNMMAPASAEARQPDAAPANAAAPATLRGSIDVPANNLGPIPVGGLRVELFSLPNVERALAPARAAARTTRERLDPLIAQKRADLKRRQAEEREALQMWRASSPDDSVRSSLRFAYTSAAGLTRTAEKDLHYLLDERASMAGGTMFMANLPAPIASAQTDEQGAFTLNLPADGGDLALAVTTRQPENESGAVPRYWLVKLTERQRAGLDPITLADANATTSTDAASLVQTAD